MDTIANLPKYRAPVLQHSLTKSEHSDSNHVHGCKNKRVVIRPSGKVWSTSPESMTKSYLLDELCGLLANPREDSIAQDDWNGRFQKIKALPDGLVKYTLMNGLNRDFIASASVYAKTIISEYFLEDSLKSIRVQEIGGQAGGKKFLWRGILFKLAYANQGPYTGNDEAAAKAMGHELKGGNSYFRCEVAGLHVALQALIDYKGFRMHAQAWLPIDHTTLKVGTSDACKEVHASSEDLLLMLKRAAKELNLQPHVIKGKMLYAGCDVEGHVGHDGQFYIVDLSRTFPPESPRVASHLLARPDGHVPGAAVTVSVSTTGNLCEGRRVQHSIRGRVYARNNDGTFDIRLERDVEERKKAEEDREASDHRALDEETVVLFSSSEDVYLRQVRPEDISSGLDSGLSIYWRLLRPEFVKHRGTRILNALRSIQARRKRGTAAPYVLSTSSNSATAGESNDSGNSAHDDIVEAHATIINQSNSIEAQESQKTVHVTWGYNEAELLIQNCRHDGMYPDPLVMSRSFSSPVQSATSVRAPWTTSEYADSSLMTRPGVILTRHASSSAVCRRDEFRLTAEMVELTQANGGENYEEEEDEFDLNTLPGATTRLRQVSSDAVYENMPQPDSLEVCRTQSDSWVGGCMDNEGDLTTPTLTQRCSSSIFERSQHLNVIDVEGLLKKFVSITGMEYTPSSPFAVPLSPDALSSFSKSDPECNTHNQEIEKATALLVFCIIPALAVDLLENGHPKERQGLGITEYMHHHGVNIRHIGLLRHHLRRQQEVLSSKGDFEDTNVSAKIQLAVQLQSELLLECVGRALKNILRDMMRLWMCSQRTASEDGIVQLVVRFLNMVTGYHHQAGEFWSTMVIPGVVLRFGELAFSAEEGYLQAGGVDGKRGLPLLFDVISGGVGQEDLLVSLLLKLCKRTGVRLSRECKRQFRSGNSTRFEFAVSDVVEIIPVVKHMHQVDLGEGLMLSLRGQDKENESAGSGVIVRLMHLAVNKLHAALKAVPDDERTINGLADAYQTLAFAEWQAQEQGGDGKSSYEMEATEGFRLYRSLLSDDPHSRCSHTGLSYKDDILGVCLEMRHFKSASERGRGPRQEEPHVRIETVHVHLEVMSLTYFRRHHVPRRGNGRSPPSRSSKVRRFFPLIVNREHGNLAQRLLREEIVRADQLGDKHYTHPVGPLGAETDVDTQLVGERGWCLYEILPCPVPLPPFSSGAALRVISAVMNSMVVEFASRAEEGSLSDSSLLGFSRFHHMLLFLSQEFPDIRATANATVEDFVSHRISRSKVVTKDLGRLLVYLLLSNRIWDAAFRDAFIEETLARQVNWIVKEHGHPELLVLEKDDVSVYRLATTFKANIRSLRIVMFQVYFLLSVARKATRVTTIEEAATISEGQLYPRTQLLGLSRRDDLIFDLYNASMGRPTAAMKNDYQRQMAEIKAVSSYDGFLRRIGCDYSPAQMTVLLRNGVRACCSKKYGGMRPTDIIGDAQSEALPSRDDSGAEMTWQEAIAAASDVGRMEVWQTLSRSVWEQKCKERIDSGESCTPARRRTTSGSSSCSQESDSLERTEREIPQFSQGRRRPSTGRGGGQTSDRTGQVRGGRAVRGGGGTSRTKDTGILSRADSDKNWRQR